MTKVIKGAACHGNRMLAHVRGDMREMAGAAKFFMDRLYPDSAALARSGRNVPI